jgi:hypothetical protein
MATTTLRQFRKRLLRTEHHIPHCAQTAHKKYVAIITEGVFRQSPVFSGKFGSGGRDRTYDQLINSQLLYR